MSDFRSILIYRSSGAGGFDVAAQQHYRDRGFTLPELLITVAVSAILLAVAVPNFQSFIQNARVGSTADRFLTAIQQARSEAITRGNVVALCRTGDPDAQACKANDPDGNANQERDWTYGWVTYANTDFTGEEDYNAGDATHELLKLGFRAPEGVEITSDTNGNNWLTFATDGTLNEDDGILYAVCDTRGDEAGKLIVIPMIGRPYITDDMTDAPDCAPTG